jgi:hypothetical protein
MLSAALPLPAAPPAAPPAAGVSVSACDVRVLPRRVLGLLYAAHSLTRTGVLLLLPVDCSSWLYRFLSSRSERGSCRDSCNQQEQTRLTEATQFVQH